jgi:hypothetical protein
MFYGTDVGPRTANNELLFCVEEGVSNPPGSIPGSIPGGPGQGVFFFVRDPFADDEDSEGNEPLYAAPNGYLY